MIARHILHAFDVALFALLKHLLKVLQLHGEHVDVITDMIDVMLYGVNRTLASAYIAADSLEVLEFLAHRCLVGPERLLLFLDVLLYLSLLLTQSLDGRISDSRLLTFLLLRSLTLRLLCRLLRRLGRSLLRCLTNSSSLLGT